ncbi:MAG: 30S ribosomal protein S17 [Promethearchaeota archaeon]
MRNIGIPVQNPPKTVCNDKFCPFHGHLKLRGKIIQGTVINTKMNKTVVIQREYVTFDRKYERYSRHRSKIPAHQPECLELEEGDIVKIMECRPISKTVSFVVFDRVKGVKS